MTWEQALEWMRRKWDADIACACKNLEFTMRDAGAFTADRERGVADLRAHLEKLRDEELTAKH